ncbi:hypothetical protein C7S20_18380 [Christiangramia fulva]|uniref:Uncharacterized protein n=1 Tax=Christiangramia fulva TaxID=2126553 RepID=A0A2R3Z9V4_9FLAO|nr:hypothetical protein [Christiangramia fulva]AVR47056.1 hypothetical protein C7S20_18380 [Christiangramia fulva]
MKSNLKDVMVNHSNKTLCEILRTRNKYTPEAIDLAIEESLKRGLLAGVGELDAKFPIAEEVSPLKKPKTEEEKGILKKASKDFNSKEGYLYLIGLTTGSYIFFTMGSIPIVPVVFIVLVFYCSFYYNKLLANILIWLGAFQVVAIFFALCTLIFNYL